MRVSIFPSATLAALTAVVLLALAGCGGSSSKSSAGTSGKATSSAEARATASGDIPDNQVFLTLTDRAGGWSMRYPEGWSQRVTGGGVALSDKANSVQVSIASAPAPTVAGVRAELQRARAQDPSVQIGSVAPITLKAGPGVKASYRRLGPADPVTGKRTTLLVDRYELSRGAKRAVVELRSPRGVDNVDAYRMMIGSFRWR